MGEIMDSYYFPIDINICSARNLRLGGDTGTARQRRTGRVQPQPATPPGRHPLQRKLQQRDPGQRADLLLSPYLSINCLKQIVEGLQAMGYTFTPADTVKQG